MNVMTQTYQVDVSRKEAEVCCREGSDLLGQYRNIGGQQTVGEETLDAETSV